MLAWSLGAGAQGPAGWRALLLAPLLGGFGLLFDVLRAARPDVWRASHPGRLWMSRPFKIVLYWTACYPLVRLAQDVGTLALARSDGALPESLAHLSSGSGLVLFLLFQTVFGTAYGIGFAVLYRVTGGR